MNMLSEQIVEVVRKSVDSVCPKIDPIRKKEPWEDDTLKKLTNELRNCSDRQHTRKLQKSIKGELTRKNKLGSFCSEFACDLKSETIFLIYALNFPLFTRLCVNDVIPTPREISEVKTKFSACVIKMIG